MSKQALSHEDSACLSFKFVVFSLQQMVKNLKPSSTNYKEKGASHDGRILHATAPSPVCDTVGAAPTGGPLGAEGFPKRRCQFEFIAAQPHLNPRKSRESRKR